jgi:hypothetical protein
VQATANKVGTYRHWYERRSDSIMQIANTAPGGGRLRDAASVPHVVVEAWRPMMSVADLITLDTTARRVLAGGIALLAAGAALGYWIGTSRGGVSEYMGDAYSTELQIGIQTEDWSYEVPLDVQWTDAQGGWHSGSRPECLPPSGVLPDVRFAAVPVETRGMGFRQVVAIFCD